MPVPISFKDIEVLKLSFRIILIITGATLAVIGGFATLVNYLPTLNVPNYAHKGNTITGLVLIVIGIYTLILGIFDDQK